MNYNYIVNPLTNRKCSIHTPTGKKVLNNYIIQKRGGYQRKFTHEDLVKAFDWNRQGPYDCCPCNFYYLKLLTKELSVKIAQKYTQGIPDVNTFINGFQGLFPDYNFSIMSFKVIPNIPKMREQNKQVLNTMFSAGIIDLDTAVLVMGEKPDINHCISFAYITVNGKPTPYVLDPQIQEAIAGDDILNWIDRFKYTQFNILRSEAKDRFTTPKLELNAEAFRRMSEAKI